MGGLGGLAVSLVASVAVLLACQTTETVAPDRAWDQAAVTNLAKQLTPITERLFTAIFQEGQPIDMPSAMGAGDDYHDFKDSIRVMNEEAMYLADALEKGQGRAQTLPVIERLDELNDDAKQYAADQFTESPVNSDLASMEKIIDQLRDYYGR